MNVLHLGRGKRLSRSFCCSMLILLGCGLGWSQPAAAVVLFFDGFGDADLNNNGISLEGADVDMTLEGDPTYEPPEFVGSTVTILSSVEDASDTGLPWFASRGWTSGAPFYAKANIKIMDDTTGAFPETAPGGVPALNSGNAMAWDSKGRGSSATAFFGQRVSLGPEVGDQIKVGFDFRTWQSSPNANNFTPPELAELRFGLYQDTDNQLGMINSFAGKPDDLSGIPTAAVWGEEDGHFRGDSIGLGPGAIGDHGWYAAIELGDPDSPFGPLPGGPMARIREETNEEQVPGDTASIKFMEGPDDDFVAKPSTDPAPDFVSMDSTQPYRLELTLERATEETPGDTILATFDVTHLVTGEMWSFGRQEPLFNDDGMGGMIPDGISSDSWDYFALRNTGADDYDFLIDNFKLELFGSNVPTGPDFNGDGTADCADVDSLVAAIVGGTNDPTYDMNGDGDVDTDDLQQWLVDAGNQEIGAPISQATRI